MTAKASPMARPIPEPSKVLFSFCYALYDDLMQERGPEINGVSAKIFFSWQLLRCFAY
jgi:hypothetical protein